MKESWPLMNPVSKLYVGGVVVILASTYLAYLGASSSWQFYVTVDELVADIESFYEHRIRVSGRVAPASLRVASNRSQGAFLLEGTQSAVEVEFTGPVADNLAEGVDVVVEGQMRKAGIVQGDKVLTRCASKYASTP